MVKGYLAGTRKERHRQARADEEDRKAEGAQRNSKKRTRDTDTEEDDPSSEAGLHSYKVARVNVPLNLIKTSAQAKLRKLGHSFVRSSISTSTNSSFSLAPTKTTKRQPGAEGEMEDPSGKRRTSSQGGNLGASTRKQQPARNRERKSENQKVREGRKDEETAMAPTERSLMKRKAVVESGDEKSGDEEERSDEEEGSDEEERSGDEEEDSEDD